MNNLVTTDWLAEHLHDDDIVIADVRWVHQNSAAAYQSYLTGHIPRAIFIDVDQVLSEIGDARKGRHPLPNPEMMVARLAAKGIGRGKRVIATEEDTGKVAARLWWLLKWVGFDDVAVLDGGLTKWKAEGRLVEQHETVLPPAHPYEIKLRPEIMLSAEEIAELIAHGGKVFDARAAERFRGEIEALDKRAGHIEGAGNIPLAVLYEGEPPRLKSPEKLRALLAEQGLSEGKRAVAYCGSGVTACQLLWAMDRAGFTDLYLYPGSWSEWIELHPEAGRVLT